MADNRSTFEIRRDLLHFIYICILDWRRRGNDDFQKILYFLFQVSTRQYISLTMEKDWVWNGWKRMENCLCQANISKKQQSEINYIIFFPLKLPEVTKAILPFLFLPFPLFFTDGLHRLLNHLLCTAVSSFMLSWILNM